MSSSWTAVRTALKRIGRTVHYIFVPPQHYRGYRELRVEACEERVCLAPIASVTATNASSEMDQMLVTISLDVMAETTTAVDYAIVALTATAGDDFYLVGAPPGVLSGTVTFAQWEMQSSFYIAAVSDTLFEGDESLRIDLSNPVNATLSATESSATAWIIDDDINFAPQAIPMVEEFRWMENASEVVVSLGAYFSDSNDPLSSLTWTITPTGTPAPTSYWVDGGQQLHLQFPTGTYGVTNVQVRGTDPHGAFAESDLDVWSVAIGGMSIEENFWGEEDDTWSPAAGDSLWTSERHRWTTTIQPPAAEAYVVDVSWWAEPWVGQTEPVGNGASFAIASGLLPAIGSPAAGDWFIYPVALVGAAHVQAEGPGERKPVFRVERVEWQGVDPGDGVTNLTDAGVMSVIYPERNHPVGTVNEAGQPLDQIHDKINIRVFLVPAVPADLPPQTVWLRVKDPDSRIMGAADPSVPGDPSQAPNDNIGDGGGDDIGITPGGAVELTVAPNQNSGTKQFTIDEPQPGNNFIVVAHGARKTVDNLHFKDDGVTLYARIPPSTKSFDVPESHRSNMLEVHRTLWVEADHMVAPDPANPAHGQFGGVSDDVAEAPTEPTIATLTQLMAATYVWVRPMPAEYDTTATIPFEHNLQDWVIPHVRDVNSSRHFWAVHMLGAYEFIQSKDNDNEVSPDTNTEDWLAGWSEGTHDPHPTNFVFHETIRDLWAEPEMPGMVGVELGRDRVAAHEALHRFFGWHLSPESPGFPGPADQGIMTPSVLMTAPTVSLTDDQIRVIQAIVNPK